MVACMTGSTQSGGGCRVVAPSEALTLAAGPHTGLDCRQVGGRGRPFRDGPYTMSDRTGSKETARRGRATQRAIHHGKPKANSAPSAVAATAMP